MKSAKQIQSTPLKPCGSGMPSYCGPQGATGRAMGYVGMRNTFTCGARAHADGARGPRVPWEAQGSHGGPGPPQTRAQGPRGPVFPQASKAPGLHRAALAPWAASPPIKLRCGPIISRNHFLLMVCSESITCQLNSQFYDFWTTFQWFQSLLVNVVCEKKT